MEFIHECLWYLNQCFNSKRKETLAFDTTLPVVNLSLCVLPSHVFVPFTGVVIWTNLEKWGEEGGWELPQVFQFWAMLFAAACRENDTSQTVVKVTRMDLRAKIIVFAVSGAETLLLVGAAAKLCSSAHCVCERQCRTQMRGSRLQATKWHFPCFSLNSRLWCSHNLRKKRGQFISSGLKTRFDCLLIYEK